MTHPLKSRTVTATPKRRRIRPITLLTPVANPVAPAATTKKTTSCVEVPKSKKSSHPSFPFLSPVPPDPTQPVMQVYDRHMSYYTSVPTHIAAPEDITMTFFSHFNPPSMANVAAEGIINGVRGLVASTDIQRGDVICKIHSADAITETLAYHSLIGECIRDILVNPPQQLLPSASCCTGAHHCIEKINIKRQKIRKAGQTLPNSNSLNDDSDILYIDYYRNELKSIFYDEHDNIVVTPGHVILFFYLMYSRFIGNVPAPRHQPQHPNIQSQSPSPQTIYARWLPDSYSLPICYPTTIMQLSTFSSTDMYKSTLYRIKHLHRIYHTIFPLLVLKYGEIFNHHFTSINSSLPTFNFQRFVWAYCAYTSRSFPSHFIQHYTSLNKLYEFNYNILFYQSKQDSNHQTKDHGDDTILTALTQKPIALCGVMLPFLDLTNHKESHQIHWLYGQHTSRSKNDVRKKIISSAQSQVTNYSRVDQIGWMILDSTRKPPHNMNKKVSAFIKHHNEINANVKSTLGLFPTIISPNFIYDFTPLHIFQTNSTLFKKNNIAFAPDTVVTSTSIRSLSKKKNINSEINSDVIRLTESSAEKIAQDECDNILHSFTYTPFIIENDPSQPLLQQQSYSPNTDKAQINPNGTISNNYISYQSCYNYTKGEEIYNNYGPKSQDELLFGYGFITENLIPGPQHCMSQLYQPFQLSLCPYNTLTLQLSSNLASINRDQNNNTKSPHLQQFIIQQYLSFLQHSANHNNKNKNKNQSVLMNKNPFIFDLTLTELPYGVANMITLLSLTNNNYEEIQSQLQQTRSDVINVIGNGNNNSSLINVMDYITPTMKKCGLLILLQQLLYKLNHITIFTTTNNTPTETIHTFITRHMHHFHNHIKNIAAYFALHLDDASRTSSKINTALLLPSSTTHLTALFTKTSIFQHHLPTLYMTYMSYLLNDLVMLVYYLYPTLIGVHRDNSSIFGDHCGDDHTFISALVKSNAIYHYFNNPTTILATTGNDITLKNYIYELYCIYCYFISQKLILLININHTLTLLIDLHQATQSSLLHNYVAIFPLSFKKKTLKFMGVPIVKPHHSFVIWSHILKLCNNLISSKNGSHGTVINDIDPTLFHCNMYYGENGLWYQKPQSNDNTNPPSKNTQSLLLSFPLEYCVSLNLPQTYFDEIAHTATNNQIVPIFPALHTMISMIRSSVCTILGSYDAYIELALYMLHLQYRFFIYHYYHHKMLFSFVPCSMKGCIEYNADIRAIIPTCYEYVMFLLWSPILFTYKTYNRYDGANSSMIDDKHISTNTPADLIDELRAHLFPTMNHVSQKPTQLPKKQRKPQQLSSQQPSTATTTIHETLPPLLLFRHDVLPHQFMNINLVTIADYYRGCYCSNHIINHSNTVGGDEPDDDDDSYNTFSLHHSNNHDCLTCTQYCQSSAPSHCYAMRSVSSEEDIIMMLFEKYKDIFVLIQQAADEQFLTIYPHANPNNQLSLFEPRLIFNRLNNNIDIPGNCTDDKVDEAYIKDYHDNLIYGLKRMTHLIQLLKITINTPIIYPPPPPALCTLSSIGLLPIPFPFQQHNVNDALTNTTFAPPIIAATVTNNTSSYSITSLEIPHDVSLCGPQRHIELILSTFIESTALSNQSSSVNNPVILNAMYLPQLQQQCVGSRLKQPTNNIQNVNPVIAQWGRIYTHYRESMGTKSLSHIFYDHHAKYKNFYNNTPFVHCPNNPSKQPCIDHNVVDIALPYRYEPSDITLCFNLNHYYHTFIHAAISANLCVSKSIQTLSPQFPVVMKFPRQPHIHSNSPYFIFIPVEILNSLSFTKFEAQNSKSLQSSYAKFTAPLVLPYIPTQVSFMCLDWFLHQFFKLASISVTFPQQSTVRFPRYVIDFLGRYDVDTIINMIKIKSSLIQPNPQQEPLSFLTFFTPHNHHQDGINTSLVNDNIMQLLIDILLIASVECDNFGTLDGQNNELFGIQTENDDEQDFATLLGISVSESDDESKENDFATLLGISVSESDDDDDDDDDDENNNNYDNNINDIMIRDSDKCLPQTTGIKKSIVSCREKKILSAIHQQVNKQFSASPTTSLIVTRAIEYFRWGSIIHNIVYQKALCHIIALQKIVLNNIVISQNATVDLLRALLKILQHEYDIPFATVGNESIDGDSDPIMVNQHQYHDLKPIIIYHVMYLSNYLTILNNIEQ